MVGQGRWGDFRRWALRALGVRGLFISGVKVKDLKCERGGRVWFFWESVCCGWVCWIEIYKVRLSHLGQ